MLHCWRRLEFRCCVTSLLAVQQIVDLIFEWFHLESYPCDSKYCIAIFTLGLARAVIIVLCVCWFVTIGILSKPCPTSKQDTRARTATNHSNQENGHRVAKREKLAPNLYSNSVLRRYKIQIKWRIAINCAWAVVYMTLFEFGSTDPKNCTDSKCFASARGILYYLLSCSTAGQLLYQPPASATSYEATAVEPSNSWAVYLSPRQRYAWRRSRLRWIFEVWVLWTLLNSYRQTTSASLTSSSVTTSTVQDVTHPTTLPTTLSTTLSTTDAATTPPADSPPPGYWSDWTNWSACSTVQCNDRWRTRVCVGTGCEGMDRQTIEGTWNSWGDWNSWTVVENECLRRRPRSRTCDNGCLVTSSGSDIKDERMFLHRGSCYFLLQRTSQFADTDQACEAEGGSGYSAVRDNDHFNWIVEEIRSLHPNEITEIFTGNGYDHFVSVFLASSSDVIWYDDTYSPAPGDGNIIEMVVSENKAGYRIVQAVSDTTTYVYCVI